MKEYKLESILVQMKLSLKADNILERSHGMIQEKLDENAKEGWRLVSTDAIGQGSVFIYLYFERDKA